MTFVAPAAFALAALAVPIVLLYMLRSRRARTPVSSTLLWAGEQRNVSANTPWQPLRLSLLLLLQLLALLLLVLALARPARSTSVPIGEHTVLILDTSASMQADDGGRSRFESARRLALDTVVQLAGGRRMSVVEAGPTPRVVLSSSSDQRALVEAISSLRPGDGVADAAGAFALGASLETLDVPTILHFFSDGGIRAEDRAEIPASLVHRPVGRPAGNLGITRLSAQPQGGGWDAFVHLTNAGGARVDATLVLAADDTVLATRPVRAEPRSGQDVTVSLPRLDGARLTARLEDARAAPGTVGEAETVDALAADDRAQAVLEASGMRVLLVTPGNVFLESLLRSVPGAEVSVAASAATARGFTLAVYDRVDPPAKLEAPSLVIAPPHGAPGVAVRGSLSGPIVTFTQPREPILERVDLSRLAIRRAQRIAAPGMRTLVGAGDDALLALGVPGGRRLAYLAFDLRESNLPVQVAFPLLFGNLLSWAAQGDAGDRASLLAGDPLPLRVPGGADRVVVRTPAGDEVARDAVQAAFDETATAGFYTARYLAGDEPIGTETFAVNVPALESDLTPRPVTGPLEQRGAGAGRLAGLRAWGPGIAALALAVLLAEWWLAHGRPRPRRRPHVRGPRAREAA